MVGTHINRNITWAEQAKPLMTYFARVSYMLQQGSPVADLAYLLPEGAPSTMPFWGAGLLPAPPAGYDYDYVNTDILLHHTSVAADGGFMWTAAPHADGMTYRVLVLPPTTQMTPEVLRKLHELVAAGATIVGPRPTSSPSLLHYPDADSEVHTLATDLWGDMDGVTDTQHAFGKGMTYSGTDARRGAAPSRRFAGLCCERHAGCRSGVGASAYRRYGYLLCRESVGCAATPRCALSH